MVSPSLTAYHGKQSVKAKYLRRLKLHREADVLTQGVGWESNGITRGCAVGCTLEAYDHSRYPVELGIPVELAHLEDAIFEKLERAEAMKWPEAFLKAIQPGADLSMVWPRFTLWLLSDEGSPMWKSAQDASVKPVIDGVAALYREWVTTGVKPSLERFSARAESAAWAARAAWAASAARAARAARAERAASAESAASAARAAWAASAASAARAASAESAAWAASWSKAWLSMRDQLLSLLKSAPKSKAVTL